MTEFTKMEFRHRHIAQMDDVTDLVGMLFPGNRNQQHAAARILLALKAAGEPKLGGHDFNQCLKEIALEAAQQKLGRCPTPESDPEFFQDLEQRAEQAKLALSQRPKAPIVMSCSGNVINTVIERTVFEQRCHELIAKTMDRIDQALVDAGVLPKDLREILAVGGATAMPMFARAFEARFSRSPTPHVEPYYAAATGGVVLGRLEAERQGRAVTVGGRRLPPLDIHVRDITTHPIGVSVLDEGQQLVNSVILPKGSPIPCDRTAPHCLCMPGQTQALIELLQGPDAVAREQCLLLGHFELKGMPSILDRQHVVDIRMRIDRNGMLEALATDRESGISENLQIEYRKQMGDPLASI